ncbi:MAG: TetR/AcrR family transcriptional regulator [Ruminococcaceae bacterium]|nr:TetR/AcrR family transcriptional regulator [Oscillospiraceae bacterium]
MPPKVKFSREQIVDAAYELIRKEGKDALTARNLASALGTSTAPIFTAFESIEALTDAVTARAMARYDAYLSEGLSHPIPFKGAGCAHIRFAKDEPLLFRFLFIEREGQPPVLHYLPGSGYNEERVRGTLESSYGYETESAKRLYNHLSVYVHGLAMLYAFGHCVFDEKDIDGMLFEVFHALKAKNEVKDKNHDQN